MIRSAEEKSSSRADFPFSDFKKSCSNTTIRPSRVWLKEGFPRFRDLSMKTEFSKQGNWKCCLLRTYCDIKLSALGKGDKFLKFLRFHQMRGMFLQNMLDCGMVHIRAHDRCTGGHPENKMIYVSIFGEAAIYPLTLCVQHSSCSGSSNVRRGILYSSDKPWPHCPYWESGQWWPDSLQSAYISVKWLTLVSLNFVSIIFKILKIN